MFVPKRKSIACNLGKANLVDSWTFAFYKYTTARQTAVMWSLICTSDAAYISGKIYYFVNMTTDPFLVQKNIYFSDTRTSTLLKYNRNKKILVGRDKWLDGKHPKNWIPHQPWYRCFNNSASIKTLKIKGRQNSIQGSSSRSSKLMSRSHPTHCKCSLLKV